jgi:plasmid stabilization system protein ParE
VKVRYHPAARAEVLDAVEWYEERRPMLGQDFLTEVRRAEAMIASRPAAWPRWPGVTADVRRFKLARFPYCVAFQETSEEIVMTAVAHQKRAPFYWQDRAKP